MAFSAPGDKFPLWVWIDPSSACNLACALCYAKPSQKESHLAPAALQAILAKLMGDERILVQKLNFNWRGDPLMNPDLIELLQVIERCAPYFPWEFHTNGTRLTPSMAEAITSVVRSGKIFVSIDGGNDTTHDRNRGGGSFRKAIDGARALLAAREGNPNPELGVFQLDLGLPQDAYDPDFLDVASRVDEWVRVKPVRPTDAKRITVRRKAEAHQEASHLKTSERWWTMDAGEEEEVPSGPCFWAGNSVFIAPDGDISICLVSHSRDGVLGNIFSDSIDTILAKAAKFRNDIQQKKRSGVAHCSNCKMSEGEPRQHLFSRSFQPA